MVATGCSTSASNMVQTLAVLSVVIKYSSLNMALAVVTMILFHETSGVVFLCCRGIGPYGDDVSARRIVQSVTLRTKRTKVERCRKKLGIAVAGA